MKALGSNVKGFNSAAWATCVENVATKCHLERFSQNKESRDYLLSTESKSLIEASPKDSFWGIGISLNDPDIIKKKSKWGRNIQGESLMLARQNLK